MDSSISSRLRTLRLHWVAIGRDNHIDASNRRNHRLHAQQEELYASLENAHTAYVQFRAASYASTVTRFKEHLHAATLTAQFIAQQRVDQYLNKADIASQSRGRFLQVNAYWRLAQGLMLLTAQLDVEERLHTAQGTFRYCTNDVVADLVWYVIHRAPHFATNLFDILDRWAANVELWVAHDVHKPHGFAQYQLVLSRHPGVLTRITDDGEHEYWDRALHPAPPPTNARTDPRYAPTNYDAPHPEPRPEESDYESVRDDPDDDWKADDDWYY